MQGLWLLGAVLAWAAPAQALSQDDARHLLTRTGFGASPSEIQSLLPLSRTQAVEHLLRHSHREPQFLPRSLRSELQDLPAPLRTQMDAQMDSDSEQVAQQLAQERQARRKILRQKRLLLKAWWTQEILKTSSPLTERMTLFWHNHFTSSLQKVHRPALMLEQNLLLRRDALGNFGQFLHAIAKDPAMLVYLDGVNNRKAHGNERPNENFARELLELFTLGEGHYRESDIKEAARAFTGWSVNKAGQFVSRPRWHDAGRKTFLGQSGNWDGDQILEILLRQPQTAEFVVAKFWKALISPQPDPQWVQRWARDWRTRDGYEITKLLRTVLTSEPFWAARNRGTLIKSPVELTLGTLRSLQIQPRAQELRHLISFNRQLGQDLFDPPNVRGWPGQEDWIDSHTLPLRQRFLARISRGQAANTYSVSTWQHWLLPLPPLQRDLELGDILLEPVYELK